jgi:two-component system OmpR family sensor kinase
MAQAGQVAGFWRSVRDLPGRTPLRIKLITALLALVAIALGVISVAGIQILKTNLIGPYDNQLRGVLLHEANNLVGNYLQTGQTYRGQSFAVDWVTPGRTVHAVVTPTSQYVPNFPSQPGALAGHAISGPAVEPTQGWLGTHLNRPFTVASHDGSVRWRVLVEALQLPNGSTGAIVVAVDVSSVYTTLGNLATIDLLVSLAIIFLLAIAGIAVVRRSLRPLTEIERTAGAIAAGDLSRRVPERDPRTEVGRLGRSLNVMLSQIESAFHARARSEESALRSEEKMRQFVADASHELRTPLTAMRGFAEYYRHRGGVDTAGGGTGELSPADLDRIMRRVEQEASRMGILVEDMLLLARLDQQRPLQAQPVDLLTLAADAVHDARVVAPDRSINLTVGSGAALLVIGDEVRLRQVIGNLMSNALSHTPDGTPIDVLIRSGNLDEAPPPPVESDASDSSASAPPRRVSQPAAVLEVTDHGPGLTPEQAEHVFERFYRADQARTAGGTGLGLAIVAALVAAHGGTTWVRSEPGEGATFSFALPLSPEAVEGSNDDFANADDDDEPDDSTRPQIPSDEETQAAHGRTQRPIASAH